MLQPVRNSGAAIHARVFVVVRVEVLERGDHTSVLLVLSCHSQSVCRRHRTCQAGILSVAFLGAAPSRVTLQVNCRPPHAQGGAPLLMVNASFNSGYFPHSLHNIRVESSRKPERLGEYSGGSLAVLVVAAD